MDWRPSSSILVITSGALGNGAQIKRILWGHNDALSFIQSGLYGWTAETNEKSETSGENQFILFRDSCNFN